MTHPHVVSHQNTSRYLFRAVLSCKRCLICADFSPDSDQNTFSLEEALLWIQILAKSVLMTDLFQLLSSPDVNWWTVDYCDVFIRLSFWRHPFTSEHPLLRHWCRDTFLQTWWRNKLILILDGLWVSTFAFRGELFLKGNTPLNG